VTEEAGKPDHLVGFIARQAPTRFSPMKSSASHPELAGESIERQIKLFAERFQFGEIESLPHHLNHLGRGRIRFFPGNM
jgi:hypothetical protein